MTGSQLVVESWPRRALVVLVIVAGVLLGAAAPARAHVELVTSSPADDAVVSGEIDEIVLTFSTPAAIVGDGIIVYDSNAEPVAAMLEVVSDTEIKVVPATPLGPGRWAVTWEMQAPDSHPRSGGFEFVVEAGVAPGTDPAAGPDTATPSERQIDPGPSILAEVLPKESAIALALGAAARVVAILGALLGIGSLAFALLVFEGTQGEARLVGHWVRRAGAAIALAVPVEVIAASLDLAGGWPLAALAPGSLAAAVSGQAGVAFALRFVGATALVAGTRLSTVAVAPRPAPRGGVAVLERERFDIAASPGALIGAGVLAMSFLFDGHTVTAQPSTLVKFATLAHVVGASVWLAGVCLVATLLVRRHRRGEPLEAARLVIPFSTVAGVAVALVALAGGVLALSIADGFGTFFTTPWGRTLLGKMMLAGAAGAIGAYNHRFVVPALRHSPDDPWVERAIRRTIVIEVRLLIAVAAVTALMVGLSST